MNMSCKKVSRWHLSHYPALHTRDLVKLAFQAVFGNRHMQGSLDSIAESLSREMEQPPEEAQGMRLIDPLSADTGWLRVHLGPFARSGGDVESLALAVFESLSVPGEDPENFFHYLQCIRHLLVEENLAVPGIGITEWEVLFRESRLTPVHHSEIYRKKYHPAYRVIHSSCLHRANLQWLDDFRENF